MSAAKAFRNHEPIEGRAQAAEGLGGRNAQSLPLA